MAISSGRSPMRCCCAALPTSMISPPTAASSTRSSAAAMPATPSGSTSSAPPCRRCQIAAPRTTRRCLFIVVVLGLIAKLAGFSLLRFLRYIKDEILIVLGTASSESALPRLLIKLERLGCDKQTVGLVLPTGYAFNLDGTSLFMATGVPSDFCALESPNRGHLGPSP